MSGWGAAGRVLAVLNQLPRELPPLERQQVVWARATALLLMGQNDAARSLTHGALDDSEPGAGPRAQAPYRLGLNELLAGRSAAAAAYLETAIALQRSVPDGKAVDLLRMTFSYATVLYQLGRFDESGAQQEETAAGAAAIGHQSLEARARYNLASVRLARLRADLSLDVARDLRVRLLPGTTSSSARCCAAASSKRTPRSGNSERHGPKPSWRWPRSSPRRAGSMP